MTNKPAKTERRKQLEANILKLFEKAHEIPSTKENGIGKYTIKRALMVNDSASRISINTVKRVVDEFVKDGIIECVNPDAKTNLKFKLIVTPRRSFER